MNTLEDLQHKDLLNICFTSPGQLTVQNLGKHLKTSIHQHPAFKSLSHKERAHFLATYYWINEYLPGPGASRLDQVRGYLNGFHHLCEMSATQNVERLFAATPALESDNYDTEFLHEQLGGWGYHQEQVELYERFVTVAPLKRKILYLNGLGQAYRYLGQFEQALQRYQKAQSLAQQDNDVLAESIAWGGMARVHYYLGNFKISINCYRQQLRLLGSGQTAKSSTGWRRYLNVFVSSPSSVLCSLDIRANLGWAYSGMGVTYATINKIKALKPLAIALGIAKEIGDDNLMAESLKGLADSYLFVGQYEIAMAYIQEYRGLAQKIENQAHQHCALYSQSNAYICLKRYSDAIASLNSALAMAHSLGHRLAEARCSNSLGIAYHYGLDDSEKALTYFHMAEHLGSSIGDVTTECLAQSHLANCYTSLGEPEKAQQYCQKARLMACQIEHLIPKAVALAALANVYWHQGKFLQCFWCLGRSFIMVPPWRSANGQLILRKAIEVMGLKADQTVTPSEVDGEDQ